MFVEFETNDGTLIVINTEYVTCVTDHPERPGKCRIFEAFTDDGSYWTVLGSLDEVRVKLNGGLGKPSD